jgi:transcriptional regulator with XRE-family HTH domain
VTEFSPERLRAARIAAGLTPEQLATAIGRSSFSTRRYESGQSRPRAGDLGRLADALGISPGDLFESDSEPVAAVQDRG